MKKYLVLSIVIVCLYLTIFITENTQAQGTTLIPNANFTENVLTIAATNESVYAGTAAGKVYKSSDYGATWENFSQGLPGNAPIQKLITDKLLDNVYLMLSNQVYKLDKPNKTWLNISSGLPNNVTFTALIAGDNEDGPLFLGTSESGVFIRGYKDNSWFAQNSGLTQLKILTLFSAGQPYVQTTNGQIYSYSQLGNWTKTQTDLPTHQLVQGGFLLSDTTTLQPSLYVSLETDLYKSNISTDTVGYGASWTRVDFTLPNNTKINAALVDQKHNLYLGTSIGTLYRGLQLADIWAWTGNLPTIQAMTTDTHSILYIATQRGVFKYAANTTNYEIAPTKSTEMHIQDRYTQSLETVIETRSNAVTKIIKFMYFSTNLIFQPPPPHMVFAGRSFNMLVFENNYLNGSFTFNAPITITMAYDISQTTKFPLETLQVYRIDGTGWTTTDINIVERTPGKIVFLTNRIFHFALFGHEIHQVYLPTLLKTYPAAPSVVDLYLNPDNRQCDSNETSFRAELWYADLDQDVGHSFKTVIHTEWLFSPSYRTMSKDFDEYKQESTSVYVNRDGRIVFYPCVPLENDTKIDITIWINDGAGNLSHRFKKFFSKSVAPVISNINYQLSTLNNVEACSFMNPVGSSFKIRFDYHDNDGTVFSNDSVLHTTAKFSPSGNTSYAEIPVYRTVQTGNIFNGTITYYPCLRYDNDTSATITLSLVDSTNLESKPLSITIPRPINANSVNESSSQYGVSPN